MKKIWQYGLMYLFIIMEISARAGGAGRSSSSSSSRSSSSSYSFSSSSSSGGSSSDGGPSVVIIIAIFLFLAYQGSKMAKNKDKNKKKSLSEDGKKNLQNLKENKGFDENEFIEKAKKTFIKVQNAWGEQDLKSIRNLISDGVYQKFSTQILMMKSLKQYNRIEYLKVMDTKIVGIEIDGDYDIVHVEIKANINEKFVSMIDSSLNENIEETFKEYWSFIREKNHNNGNLLDFDICPSCGAKLEDVENIEIAKCQYCNSILNTGEYDWVLSEITQRSVDISIGMNRRKELTEKFQEMFGKGVDFSKQLLEDKVSNGVVQIDKAIALNKPYLAKRFVTDEIYEQIATNKEGYIFNRYYTTDCGLYVIDEDKENYYVKVNVEREYQRVRLIDNKIVPIDTDFKKKTARVKLMKKKEESETKGSIYANQCAVCGGALEDTIDTHCPYCGEVIADPRYDWIIYEIEGLIE